MKEFCVALFGCGRMGVIHAQNLAKLKNVQLKYIVDKDLKLAQQIAESHQAEVGEEAKIFADSQVNAIIIATPTPFHLELIEKALQHKKHIFCEKPLASNAQQAQEILDLLKNSDVTFLMGFQRRFDPSFFALYQQLNEGKIGELRHLLIISRDPEPAPLDLVKVSGGLVRDMMIHDLDMALWLLKEEIVEIQAIGCNKVSEKIEKIGDIDTAYVTLKTKSNKVAQIINSRACAYGYDQRIEAFGKKGALFVDNYKENQTRYASCEGIVESKNIHFFLQRYGLAYQLELKDFFSAIKYKRPTRANAKDGLNAILLAERIMEKLPQIKL